MLVLRTQEFYEHIFRVFRAEDLSSFLYIFGSFIDIFLVCLELTTLFVDIYI